MAKQFLIWTVASSLTAFLALTACNNWTVDETNDNQKLGEEIILKIEAYKKTKGHLPNNLADIGVVEKEDGPVYYTKQTDTTYIVYYGLALGESIFYNHKTKQWESDRQ